MSGKKRSEQFEEQNRTDGDRLLAEGHHDWRRVGGPSVKPSAGIDVRGQMPAALGAYAQAGSIRLPPSGPETRERKVFVRGRRPVAMVRLIGVAMGLAFLAVGALTCLRPRPVARFREQLDAIGRTTSPAEVEPPAGGSPARGSQGPSSRWRASCSWR